MLTGIFNVGYGRFFSQGIIVLYELISCSFFNDLKDKEIVLYSHLSKQKSHSCAANVFLCLFYSYSLLPVCPAF